MTFRQTSGANRHSFQRFSGSALITHELSRSSFYLSMRQRFCNLAAMKGLNFFPVTLLALAGIFDFAGCDTNSPKVTKDRGVYTTVAMEGQYLDLPASGYTSCKTFGPSQTPAAVVVGYGYWDGTYNRPQAFDLEVVEAASGSVVFNFTGNDFAGKAAVINLPIRKSGDYRLKLIVNNSVYDTWDFTVNREGSATASAAVQPPIYAKGYFSTSIEGLQTTDAFYKYDDSLLQAINDAVQKEHAIANHDIFAQVPPGHVVVQFELSETGQVISPKIVGNTLNEALGRFFLKALQNGSPYKAWPAAARAAIGTSSRSVKVTFFYD